MFKLILRYLPTILTLSEIVLKKLKKKSKKDV